MADFNFEIDFLLQTSKLAADLAKIEKSTTQSADQLAKVWKDAFSKRHKALWGSNQRHCCSF
jgi:hypothetical protein